MSTDQHNPSIDALIHQARDGSDEAVGELLETFRSYLLLIANQDMEPLLKTKVAPSDLVQDACASAYQRFATFRGVTVDELKSWLAQVLRNQLSDWRRKYVQSDKRCAAREVGLQADSDWMDVREPADQAASPPAGLIAEEEAAALHAAMLRLPEDYRRVVELRNWDLLSFEDIAERTGRSAEAVRKLWSRAVDRLQHELSVFIRSDDSR
ncbi:MAG TPA: sigma-70 family RNA polymerase sigma factor [Planctomycetaceae bacterium]|nr:sigma-70 family RNA polymerase sigma factor [Planctomycetaceae bacterium]